MKQLLFFVSILCFTVFANNTLLAQYSNATLNGPWFFDSNPPSIYDCDSTNYFVFDGNGNIIDMSGFCSSTIGGNYSVTTGGAISMTLSCDGTSVSSLAQLTSQNTGTADYGTVSMSLSRITNPGALTDSLVGVLYTESCGQKNVMLRIDSQGQIISASGLTPPVTGRVYADSGHFEGHIHTGEISGAWQQQFTIVGAYANDSLIGKVWLDCGDCNCGEGTARLKRFGNVTGIAPISASTSELTIYPNPASDIVTLNINKGNNADLVLNIYNVIGTLVKSETLKQNQRQINIGDLSNGTYIVEIKSKEWNGNQKLIIQR